jgi:hypothetical protein
LALCGKVKILCLDIDDFEYGFTVIVGLGIDFVVAILIALAYVIGKVN